jgi:hypothetical protein
MSKSVISGKYKYESLPDSSSIRLLRVEAATASDPIRSSLKLVDLNENPTFLALSYSWKEDQSLVSLGRTFAQAQLQFSGWRATQNFEATLGQRDYISNDENRVKHKEILEKLSAVHSFKGKWIPQIIFCDGQSIAVQPNLYNALLHLRKGKTGNYWIDAVCINQEDSIDRSAQVQMMGKVYQSVADVVVWLGDAPFLLDPGVRRFYGRLAPSSSNTASNLSDMDLSATGLIGQSSEWRRCRY